MSWIDQGRQQHGWFGNGTASARPASARDLRARAFAIVHLANDHVAELGAEPFPLEKTIEVLRTLAPMMAPSSHQSPNDFRQRFFRNGFDPVDAWHLQLFMRDVAHADDHVGLNDAGQVLARIIDAYGPKDWSSMLGRTVASITPAQRSDAPAAPGPIQKTQLTLPAPAILPLPPVAVPGSRENEEHFVKPIIRLGRAIGDAVGNILHSKPSREGDGYDGGADKPPVGSRPINQTPWSGDHGKIKEAIQAAPNDDTRISPNGDVWSQHPDGSWTNHGPASNLTASGQPNGQRGRDRK